MGYVLYKLAAGWGLPSLSPACIQAEVDIYTTDIEEFGSESVVQFNLVSNCGAGVLFSPGGPTSVEALIV